MKTVGVLLCGGEGQRLRPLTEVVNKHLVRLVDKPMAEYPLLKMIQAGVKDIMIVTGGENFAGVCKYFGSGSKWGVNINYAIQDKPGGIAQALGLARGFVGGCKSLVVLGDNVWNMDISKHLNGYSQECTLFAITTPTPERFGAFKFGADNEVVDIIEKPKEFVSNYIAVGIYVFEPNVFDLIDTLSPSDRGELEIADVIRHYLQAGKARIIKMSGWWSDCGTIETLLQAEEYIKNEG